jgi:hypothetical protein
MTMEPVWRETLLKAAQTDLETRTRLARDGSLFDGYHPEMEAVHIENAALLDEAFRTIGWPGRHLVDDDGAAAAILILQHAISRPDLQRRGLALMLEAIPRGDANMIDAAYLSDRIAVFEGRPQLYGTQFDWFDGALAPSPIEKPEQVEQRRASVGLPSLAEIIAAQRERAALEGEEPPRDLDARKAAFDLWAQKVGWRE